MRSKGTARNIQSQLPVLDVKLRAHQYYFGRYLRNDFSTRKRFIYFPRWEKNSIQGFAFQNKRMKIIDQIMRSEYFRDQPPVLIDIGASGGLHSKWKYIAKYAYCVAFDADEREFQISEEINKDYKKLIHINRIVTALPSGNANFYLTYSPFCSSLLEPDEEKLSPWLFKPLFEVKKIKA